MTADRTKDALIGSVDSAVRQTLGYFEGPGQSTTARVGEWGAWDVLAHFPYWHYATAWGVRSAALGGPPWQVSGSADEINAGCLALLEGEGFETLIGQLRDAQERLVRAARATENLEAIAFRMLDGREVSIGQRLETIARHWRGHLEALQNGGAKGPPL